ncbi:uncharacterized protein BX663DRAFT_548680 [Cokeromyces recurvatus]|uniref:uncharacterized protein n=1 Tax=Cokeromyces recurvatus TaxID=90255 RepID=UPI00221F02BA|nr:uncharacterized protein BX663DRAFT_548680 [Cokeromyces recurvatus]KAI7906505.1 hypothetical protein BX663DRAFT_548680 [Cokeromyces recurvatus]
MFQSKEYIERRHGRTGTDRAYFLSQLVQEYNTTKSQEAKQQVLANLANFAYDPINYDTLWGLRVIDLFLNALTDNDPLIQEFGMGGLANICLDPHHHEYIMSQPMYRNNIIQCLSSSNSTKIKINAMTTLMQLITAENYHVILTAELEEYLLQIKDDHQHKQASRMAALFLIDYYHRSIF